MTINAVNCISSEEIQINRDKDKPAKLHFISFVEACRFHIPNESKIENRNLGTMVAQLW